MGKRETPGVRLPAPPGNCQPLETHAATKGTTILFVGPSGIGRAMTAALLANDLSLDLFRIDLSRIVKKCIGETEKNLDRIFHEVEDSNLVLLFDEGDALFGHCTEVEDSHDRYANVEAAYLLQRMGDYQGLTILAINHLRVVDKPVLGRFDCIVEFRSPASRLTDN